MFYLLFIVSLSFGGNTESSYVSFREASEFVGRVTSICGNVKHVVRTTDNRHPNKIYFEDYAGIFSSKKYYFNGIIWSDRIPYLEVNLNSILNKDICVKGFVSNYKGTPQITVSDSNQISFTKTGAL